MSIHIVASGAGYVDAGAEVLTGTYRPVVDAFEASPSGTFVFKVMGMSSATPGATATVNVSVTTFSGYGTSFQPGTKTQANFLITTAR